MNGKWVWALFCAVAMWGASAPTPVAGGTYAGDGGPAIRALLGQAEGVAVDRQGNLLICDAADHRVRRVVLDGSIETIAGAGMAGFSGDNGPAARALLNQPYGVAVGPDGSILIADLGNARVRRIDASGVMTTVAGGGLAEPSDGAAATSVRLNAPRNVAADDRGNIYVSDFATHTVYRIAETGQIYRVAGVGRSGSADDGDSAATAALASPAGLVVDGEGSIYIAESGSRRVRRIRQGILSTIRIVGLAGPTGLARDQRGNLYVADPAGGFRVPPVGSVQLLTATGRDIAVGYSGEVYLSQGRTVRRLSVEGFGAAFAGSDQFEFYGEGVNATVARLRRPSAIVRDGAGNLYFADEANHRVRRISAGDVISTFAGTGEAGYSGDGGPARSARLRNPSGLAIDAQGNLFIADTRNHCIRRVTAAGTMTAFAGQCGTPGFSGEGNLATLARLNLPEAVAIDRTGEVLIADTGNHAIRRVTRDGRMALVAGTGIAGAAGDGGPANRATMNSPRGLAVYGDALLVADTGNNRIRMLTGNGYTTMASVLLTMEGGLRQPMGIAVAGTDFYVADSGSGRILKVNNRGIAETFANLREFAAEAMPNSLLVIGEQVFYTDTGRHVIERLPVVAQPPAGVEDPVISGVTVVNGASFREEAITHGAIVTLFGSGIGPNEPAGGTMTDTGRLASVASGIQVTFNGRLAPIYYAGRDQINAQVPYEIGPVNACVVEVLREGKVVARSSVPVSNAAPGLFTLDSEVIATDGSGKRISLFAPARRGSVVVLYGTGEGLSQPTAATGRPAVAPLPRPILPVTVQIGGQPAEVVWAGAAPGFIGLLQVNVKVPSGFLPSGLQNIVMRVGTAPSQPGVSIAVE